MSTETDTTLSDDLRTETARMVSRRGLMIAAAAAGAGAAAGSVMGATPAGAATGSGGEVQLGDNNSGAGGTTTISTATGNGLNGTTTDSSASSCGLVGTSTAGWGVFGTRAAGHSGFTTPLAAVAGDSKDANGVVGLTANSGGNGVQGGSTTSGIGVFGWSASAIPTLDDGQADLGVYGVGGSPSGLFSSDPVGGSAVVGDSADSFGVVGLANDYAGVYGFSNGYGVLGYSNSTDGVFGNTVTTGNAGVHGEDFSTDSPGGYGIEGNSALGIGVYGWVGSESPSLALGTDTVGVYGVGPSGQSGLFSSAAAAGSAIVGDCADADGVLGLSSSSYGVYGQSTSSSGIYGTGVSGVSGAGTTGSGVNGTSSSGTGVTGSGVTGLSGTGSTGPGVSASSTEGHDIASNGTGRTFQKLQAGPGAPSGESVAYSAGESIRDSNGTLFLCVAGGSPGTWVQVAAGPVGFTQGATCLLSSPIRVFDSRTTDPPAARTRSAGPVTAGTTQTLQITGSAVSGVAVPAGAVGVIGNLTVTGATAGGYLTCYPAGVTRPPTSSINFASGSTIANGVTVALSGSGQINIYASASTQVIFDATGFVA